MDDLERNLIGGLRTTGYVYDPYHVVLGSDAHEARGPNIGKDGVNLTILFLSLNRSALSVKLLNSIAEQIPNLAGEVLVADNGSDPEELRRIREACATLPFRSRILELGANYGVAGGRNRGIRQARTDWVLSIDNDIYFTSNPLSAIQEDIALLGCHFLNLPLLNAGGQTIFAKGGHLYPGLHGTELYIGGGSVCRQGPSGQGPRTAFLSTFLFGGASVLNRHTFERLGGFDDGMFIGFEDIDFSIRLFREGLKVGNSTVEVLIHDHPKPESDGDRDYERKRFARDALKRSAEYLERKHGFRVWSHGVDEWLRSRHQELGLGDPSAAAAPPPPVQKSPAPRKRPRIALVIDTDGWAFGNIARQLERHLSDRFEFVTIPMDVLDTNVDRLLLLVSDCDLVHVFWREHLRLIGSDFARAYAEALGCPYDRFHERFVKARIFSTAVYDHLFLDKAEAEERRPIFRHLVRGYYVASRRLERIYESLEGYPPPVALLEDGVDLELFAPRDLERFQNVGRRELVVGWAGNSRWAAERGDPKGVDTILKPAVEQLRREGLPIRVFFADRAERMIPHRDMPAYYGSIDVYVCTSAMEGTPNPVLESMACGVPVISTDVGIVPDAFGPRQSQFILRERSVHCLKATLGRLTSDPSLLRDLSSENLDRIRSWDWAKKVQGFASFFDHCLGRAADVGRTAGR